MKLRHPAVIKLVGFLIACVVRVWVWTLRYRVRRLGPRVEPTEPGLEGRYLYVFWHEALLVPAYHYSGPHSRVLISQHADGEVVAQACRHLRMGVLRGSTRRDGVRALRGLIHAGKSTHLVITPDGPRGPRRRVQPGVVYAAAKTGLPVVAVGFGFHHAVRLNSWDRFALPLPWSAACAVVGVPIHVPADLSRAGMEDYRERIERALEEVTELAERDAARQRW